MSDRYGIPVIIRHAKAVDSSAVPAKTSMLELLEKMSSALHLDNIPDTMRKLKNHYKDRQFNTADLKADFRLDKQEVERVLRMFRDVHADKMIRIKGAYKSAADTWQFKNTGNFHQQE